MSDNRHDERFCHARLPACVAHKNDVNREKRTSLDFTAIRNAGLFTSQNQTGPNVRNRLASKGENRRLRSRALLNRDGCAMRILTNSSGIGIRRGIPDFVCLPSRRKV